MESMPKEQFEEHKETEQKEIVPANQEQAPNIIHMSTENADYSIVYSSHTKQNNPEQLKGADGIILEFILDYKEEENVKRVLRSAADVQYGEVFKYAAEQSIPLYFVDLSKKTGDEKDNSDYVRALKKYIAPAIGAKIGFEIAKSSFKEMKEKPITKRTFIKNLGKFFAASYASSPAAEIVSALGSTKLSSSEPDENSLVRKTERNLRDLNDEIHPELKHFSREGRNLLIAEKSESVARSLHQKLGKKPRLSLLIGSLHTDIEKAFRMNEEVRINELHTYFNDKEIQDEKTIAQVVFSPNKKDSEPEVSFMEAKIQ